MTGHRPLKRLAGIALVLMSFPLLAGCTVMANQEQLTALEEARKAADSAEAELNACKQKRAELERETAQQKQRLAKLQNDRDTVQRALNQ